jgi:hypothetical protein
VPWSASPRTPTSQAALVLTAVDRFGLDVTQAHDDLTTVEVYGAYEATEGQPPPGPRPTSGRTTSGRKHVEQVQPGLDVTGGGGVPVGHLPLDGNAAEVTSHLDNLKLLARTVPRGELLYIGDTTLDAPKDLLPIAARRGQFLCGGVPWPQLQDRHLALRGQLRPVGYFPAGQAKRPPEERGRYRAAGVAEHLDGEVGGKPVGLGHRRVFVWGESKARQEAATRERHAAKVRAEFGAVQGNLGRYRLAAAEAIVRRLEAGKGKYPEGSLFAYQLRQARGGQSHRTWGLDVDLLPETWARRYESL